MIIEVTMAEQIVFVLVGLSILGLAIYHIYRMNKIWDYKSKGEEK